MSYNHYERLNSELYKEYSLTLSVGGVFLPCKAKRYLATGFVQIDYEAYTFTVTAPTIQIPVVISGPNVNELIPSLRTRNLINIKQQSVAPFEMGFFEIDDNANSWALDKRNLTQFLADVYLLPAGRLSYIV
jgi:hypothetical protein